MHPGQDCIACHEREGRGPRFTLAGTVHAQLNEVDDCFGVSGATVQVKDVNNHLAVTLTTNEAGNFFTEAAVPNPFKIEVLASGKSNVMATPQTSGECASCHTQQGANSAPGRVQSP
jgi:cytochrome c553